uniref:G-protein coupled receptors family 1 profile domain-containing protein n=1 Tax=Gopherus agassizii TaxID=38772 RepID=A0A452IS37_9SAUR
MPGLSLISICGVGKDFSLSSDEQSLCHGRGRGSPSFAACGCGHSPALSGWVSFNHFPATAEVSGTANDTIPVTKFILLGFTSIDWESRTFLCALLSSAYTGTLAGNLCIVWTMLSDLVSPGLSISFPACFMQFYSFLSMGATKCLFLAAMALDRYLAICHPLCYPVLMSPHSCWVLVSSCWLIGFLWVIVPVTLISQLSFCGTNTLDHFVCDPAPLLAASYTPAPQAEHSCYALNSLIIFATILFILASYGLVTRAVLSLPAGAGRHKAFSTCSSHLAVVGLFYGSGMVNYVSPAASGASGKVVTLFYTVGTPLLNQLIYSLRNKEMKQVS